MFGGVGGDTINAGNGRNIVLGDNGRFDAIPDETRRWGNLPLSAGVLDAPPTRPSAASTRSRPAPASTSCSAAPQGDVIRLGGGDDIAVGDHGHVDLGRAGGHRCRCVAGRASTDNAIGGADTIYAQAGKDVSSAAPRGDDLDGGTDRDLIFGDNVDLDRTGRPSATTPARGSGRSPARRSTAPRSPTAGDGADRHDDAGVTPAAGRPASAAAGPTSPSRSRTTRATTPCDRASATTTSPAAPATT